METLDPPLTGMTKISFCPDELDLSSNASQRPSEEKTADEKSEKAGSDLTETGFPPSTGTRIRLLSLAAVTPSLVDRFAKMFLESGVHP
jgi:hypothetical protein